MNKVYIGKIINTHGIKGEIKILSNFDKKEKVFIKGNKLIIDGKTYVIENYRKHQKYDLVKLKDYDNINFVLELVGKEVYVDRNDILLNKDEYLLVDLINAKVIDDDKTLGEITDIVYGVSCNYVKVDDKYLIPLVDEYVIKFDKIKNFLYTKKASQLKELN